MIQIDFESLFLKRFHTANEAGEVNRCGYLVDKRGQGIIGIKSTSEDHGILHWKTMEALCQK